MKDIFLPTFRVDVERCLQRVNCCCASLHLRGESVCPLPCFSLPAQVASTHLTPGMCQKCVGGQVVFACLRKEQTSISIAAQWLRTYYDQTGQVVFVQL